MLTKILLPRMQMRSRLAVLLLASAAIIAPVMVRVDAQHGLRLLPAMAHAKDGDRGGDDRGGDDRGGDDRGGDDRGGDDRGGRGGDDDRGGDDHGGRGGDDDHGGDDHGGDDHGSDDHGGDDHGGRGGDDDHDDADDRDDDDRGGRRGRGRDDKPSGPVGGGYAGARPTEVERSTRGIEVTYSDGWREELENGRYELKDAQGRTVIERSATPQDRARLASFTR